jgi:hypothetical protein
VCHTSLPTVLECMQHMGMAPKAAAEPKGSRCTQRGSCGCDTHLRVIEHDHAAQDPEQMLQAGCILQVLTLLHNTQNSTEHHAAQQHSRAAQAWSPGESCRSACMITDAMAITHSDCTNRRCCQPVKSLRLLQAVSSGYLLGAAARCST